MDNKGKILWADDEIELLKPHILFLEKKGFIVNAVNSGEDALSLLKSERFDIVLLDEMMTGLDGLTTLKLIKIDHPNIPVVMITKNEDEWLMDEALGQQISNYLTKPVNPSQVLLACKSILEKSKLQYDHTAKSYLNEFNNISLDVNEAFQYSDWYAIYDKLIDWNLKIDSHSDKSLLQILNDQTLEANKKFTNFIKANYLDWLHQKNRPNLTVDIFDNFVSPILDKDEKVLLIVIDCLRMDQLKTIQDILYPQYNFKIESAFSILPTATPYSRNGIFSGLMPSEIQKRYPAFWKEPSGDESSLNAHESELLRAQLDRKGYSKKSLIYNKILTFKEGKKLENKFSDYKNADVISIVVNFVDMLGHSRSDSDVLKEMVQNESAYREAIGSWFEKSWLNNILNKIRSWDHTIILTSDHGTIRVKKPTRVKADKFASTGIRYKFGRNLKTDSNSSFVISNPGNYFLPVNDLSTNYIIASEQYFYVYPNDYRYYVNKFEDTFQHGGISLDEMIVPVAILTGY
jgi:CheY-like chemotaxis protein